MKSLILIYLLSFGGLFLFVRCAEKHPTEWYQGCPGDKGIHIPNGECLETDTGWNCEGALRPVPPGKDVGPKRNCTEE